MKLWKFIGEIFKRLNNSRFPPQRYWYKYQIHPFDDANYFSIEADSQEAANELATEKFQDIFERGGTIMTTFYPCEAPRSRFK